MNTLTEFAVATQKVENALMEVRNLVIGVEEAEEEAARRRAELADARAALEAERAAFFQAYPELLPSASPVGSSSEQGEWQPPGPGAFTPIEVDDPDDIPDFSEHR